MDDKQIRTIEQVKQFVDSSQGIEFNGLNQKEKYRWAEEVLKKFKYQQLKKASKGIIRQYVEKLTGYSRAQVNRLIMRYRQSGRIKPTEYRRHCFPRKYTMAEIALLAMTDDYTVG